MLLHTQGCELDRFFFKFKFEFRTACFIEFEFKFEFRTACFIEFKFEFGLRFFSSSQTIFKFKFNLPKQEHKLN